MVNKSQRFRMALEIETGTMLPSVPMENVILFERVRRPMFNYFWILLYIVAQALSWTYQESRGVFMFSRPRVPSISLLGWVLSHHFWFLLHIVSITFFVLIDFEAGWKGVEQPIVMLCDFFPFLQNLVTAMPTSTQKRKDREREQKSLDQWIKWLQVLYFLWNDHFNEKISQLVAIPSSCFLFSCILIPCFGVVRNRKHQQRPSSIKLLFCTSL